MPVKVTDGGWRPMGAGIRLEDPNDRPAPPTQIPVPQVSASSDSADEASTDRSAVAVSARHCVNGHEMPESHVFCTVCGGEESEEPSDFSATQPQSDSRTGLAHKIGAFYGRNGRVTPKVRILLTAVIAVCVLGLGLGLGLGLTGGSAPIPNTNTNGAVPGWGDGGADPPPQSVQEYANDLHATGNPAFASAFGDPDVADPKSLIGPALNICMGFASGDSVGKAMQTDLEGGGVPGMTKADIGTILVYAVKDMCPVYQSEVNAYVKIHGPFVTETGAAPTPEPTLAQAEDTGLLSFTSSNADLKTVPSTVLEQAATLVCTDLAQSGGASNVSASVTAVENAAQDAYDTLSPASQSVTTDDAFGFVSFADLAFCPQDASVVGDWTRSGTPGFDGSPGFTISAPPTTTAPPPPTTTAPPPPTTATTTAPPPPPPTPQTPVTTTTTIGTLEIPVVIGSTVQAAESAITSAGLSVGSVINYTNPGSCTPGPTSIIDGEDPLGVLVDPGTSINLEVCPATP